MTTAPYIGRARAEWRASCQRHQTKTDILSSAEEAHWLAADTRQFCEFCRAESEAANARRAGHVRRELERARGRPLAKAK